MNEERKGVFERFQERKRLVAREKERLQNPVENPEVDSGSSTKGTSSDFPNADADVHGETSVHDLEDKDMPSLESLNEDSDFSVFLSEKVSPTLRRRALRKMFLMPGVSVLDGLNEYDEDYTNFAALGDIIPYDMKQEMKREAKEAEEKLLRGETDGEQDQEEMLGQDGQEAPTQVVDLSSPESETASASGESEPEDEHIGEYDDG